MAMLIAWQTVNAVRRPGSQRFTYRPLPDGVGDFGIDQGREPRQVGRRAAHPKEGALIAEPAM